MRSHCGKLERFVIIFELGRPSLSAALLLILPPMNTKSTAEQRALKAEEKRAEANKALAEYRAKEEAINRNTERLRALRLAREAELPQVPSAEPPKPKRTRRV